MNEPNPNSNQPTIPPSSSPGQPQPTDAETVPPSNPGSVADDATIQPQSKPGSEPAPTIDSAGPAGTTAGGHPNVKYFGEYELLDEIARGGMGVVYKAKQLKLNRLVALKMILAGQLAGEDDVKRFHTEAEAAANLDHPGIVPIYEVGEHDGQHYFSMAFVEGPSLSAAIANGPLPPKEAAQITKAVTKAMAYAHDRGVIHRDLKPANILLAKVDGSRSTAVFLTAEGIETGWYEPKVTDFGLAKKTEGDSQLTGTGQILGTPSFMPPEQASGKTEEIGPLADVYSLGAILYCLLTGRPPFQSANVMDTLIQVLEKDPVPVRQLSPDVPKDLETICQKCLEKTAEKRYASAKDLGQELNRFLEGRPIVARPVGAIEWVWRWCKRNRFVASLLIVIAVVLLTGIVATTSFAILADSRATTNARLTEEANRQAEDARTHRMLAENNEARANREAANARQQRDLAQQNEIRAESLLYASQIRLAQIHWEQNEPDLANHYLNQCKWDLRGWEHDYLYTLFHTGFISLNGHTHQVSCVALSPDGQQIVSGSRDKTLKVWNVNTHEEILTLKGHEDGVVSVAFSPDGKHIASGSSCIKVWDAKTGELKCTSRKKIGHISGFAYSPDGKLIAACNGRIYDAKTGAETRYIKGFGASNVAFTPDGQRIVGGDFHNIEVWDVQTGEVRLTFKGIEGSGGGLAFSPDGQRIVSGGRYIKVWDSHTGREILRINGHNDTVTSVAFSPDGQRIVSGSMDKTIKIWDAKTGRELQILKGHNGYVSSVAFLDGQRIVSGAYDNTVKIWDLTTSNQNKLTGWHTRLVSCVAFSPDGLRLVSGSERITVVDAISGKLELQFFHGKRVYSVAFSPDGKQIVSGSDDKTLKVWDAKTGKERLVLDGHTGEVYSVAFSPDGKQIVSGSGDKTLKVWDAKTGEEKLTLEGHTGEVYSIAFSPDGKQIISGSGDKTLKVWDAKTGEERLVLNGHTSEVYSVAFSPDGKQIASGSGDKTLKVWDFQTGEEILTLKGHTESVRSVTFSPDGERIVSSSMLSDRTIRIWNPKTGQETLSLVGGLKNSFNEVVFSPNGEKIVGCDGYNLKVWAAKPAQ